MSLKIEDLYVGNWNEWEACIDYSERLFHPNLQWREGEVLSILLKEGAFAKVASLDGRYVGNSICGPKKFEDVAHYFDSPLEGRILSFNSIAIEPDFQRRGYATQLVHAVLEEARSLKYAHVVSWNKVPESLELFKTFGGQEIALEQNWHCSGDDYMFYHLEL